MIKNIDTLADRLKGVKVGGEDLTPEKLVSLLKDEKEVEVTVNPIHLLDETQLSELKNTVKKEGYTEGTKAGSEMFAKKLKESFGLNGDEHPGKDLDSVTKILKDKVLADAKIEPEKKVKELSESLQTLQGKYESDLNGYKSQVDSLAKTLKQKDIDFYIQSNMPQLNGIKPNHALLIYKAERQFDTDEQGNLTILKGGKPLKDNMEKPIDFQTDFTTFAKTNNWIGTDGRGGGNSYGNGSSEFKTVNDLMRHMEQQKIDPESSEGKDMIKKFQEGK